MAYDENEFPSNLAQIRTIPQDDLIAGKDYRELCIGPTVLVVPEHFLLPDSRSLCWCSMVDNDGNRRRPVMELIDPVGQGT
jgi:hypothetical protein